MVLSPCFSSNSIFRTSVSPLISIRLKIWRVMAVFGVRVNVHFFSLPFNFKSNCFSKPWVLPPKRSRKSLIWRLWPLSLLAFGLTHWLPFHCMMPSERTRRVVSNGFCIFQSRPFCGTRVKLPLVVMGLLRDLSWRCWTKLPCTFCGFCRVCANSAGENAHKAGALMRRVRERMVFFIVLP